MPSAPRNSRTKPRLVLGSLGLFLACVALPAAHAGGLDPSAASATGLKSTGKGPWLQNQIGTVVQPGEAGVSYTASFDRGWFDIELSGLPALPSARFLSYLPVEVKQAGALLAPGARFTQTQSLPMFPNETGPAAMRRIVANVKSAGSPQFLLEVFDIEGDLLCSASGSAGQMATCDFETSIEPDVPFPINVYQTRFDVRATNQGNVASQFEVESYVLNPAESTGVFSGPGMVAANDVFRVRATHNLRGVPPMRYLATFLRIYSESGQFVKEVPVRFRWDGSDYSGMPLLGTFNASTQAWRNSVSAFFSQRSVHAGTFVDVPVNATSVTFAAFRDDYYDDSNQGTARDIDLYLVPASSSAPDPSQSRVVKASVSAAAFEATRFDDSIDSSEVITVTGPDLTPGRWYVMPVSKTGEPMDMFATVRFNAFGPTPEFQSGHYYNPSRSGHGAFLDFAGDQWVMVWYTYMEDGTPTWYLASGPAPTPEVGNAIWQSTLFRVVWDGNQSFAYGAGTARVTVLGDDSFQFSYILDGEAGSETMARLGGPGCVPYNGDGLDATGHWYSPSKPGFGYSAQFEPGTEVHIAYMYDANGQPRWLYGQKSYDPAASAVNLLQLSGFCPLCPAVPTTTTQVGTMVRTLGPATAPDDLPGLTNLSVIATLAPPLSGSWNENRPVGLLSARKECR